ncbi:MAG: hypothetical protein RL398_2141 [Planctomycetota bacterium]|jgi:hypothetical protein
MRTLLFAPLLCVALTAQEAVHNRFIPADSSVVVRMAAPARMREQFQKTQFAKLFQAPSLVPLMQQIEQGAQGMMEELRTSGEFDADLLEKLWSDYRGEMTFALQFDAAGMAAAAENGETMPMAMVFAMTPAEGYDLGALAAAIAKFTEANDEGRRPLKDLQVGDHLLRITADELEPQVSIPTIIDGHLVMLMGTDLEQQAAKLVAQENRADADGTDSIYVDAKLGAAIGEFLDMVTAQADAEGAPFDVGGLMAATGLGAIDSLRLRVGAEDKHLTMAFDLDLLDKPLGLLGVAMVDQAEPKLLRYLPPSAENFACGALDIGAMYRAVGEIWGGMEMLVEMSFEDFEAMAAEELKIRLKEDLIDHLGTEMLTISDLRATMEAALADESEEDPMTMFAGSCYVLSLRDGKAFGESLEKAIRARGMHAARKSEEYQGSKIYRIAFAGLVETEYCVLDDALVVAVGGDEASRANLRAVLDQRAGGASGGLPEKVQTVVSQMPKGWSGVTVTSVTSIFGAFNGVFQQIAEMGEAPPEMDMLGQVLEGLDRDLRRLGLESMVQTTYTSKRRMATLMRW